MNAAARLLGLRLGASEPAALREVERAMKRARGNVRAAAAALGVHEVSLARWLRLPQLAGAAELRQGRASVGERLGRRPREKATAQ